MIDAGQLAVAQRIDSGQLPGGDQRLCIFRLHGKVENVGVVEYESQIEGIGTWILVMRDEVIPELAVNTGVISPGAKFIIDTLRSSGIYLGIIGIIVLAAMGYKKFQ